jgi:hypothetical protein
MTIESDAMADATIELLEARLHRLTYLLGGATDWTGTPTTPEKPASHDETVSRRIARLERELEKLSRNVPAVRDVIQLRTSSSNSEAPFQSYHNPPLQAVPFIILSLVYPPKHNTEDRIPNSYTKITY